MCTCDVFTSSTGQVRRTTLPVRLGSGGRIANAASGGPSGASTFGLASGGVCRQHVSMFRVAATHRAMTATSGFDSALLLLGLCPCAPVVQGGSWHALLQHGRRQGMCCQTGRALQGGLGSRGCFFDVHDAARGETHVVKSSQGRELFEGTGAISAMRCQ